MTATFNSKVTLILLSALALLGAALVAAKVFSPEPVALAFDLVGAVA